MRAYPLIGASLAALEWQRGCQDEAEMDWLLEQNSVTSNVAALRLALLRQTIGAALVRAGERLAGVPNGSGFPETVPAADTLGTAG